MELVVAVFAGAVVAWVVAAGRTRSSLNSILINAEGRASAAEAASEELRRSVAPLRDEAAHLHEQLRHAEISRASAESRIEEMQRGLEQQTAMLEEARSRLAETFKSLAADALKSSNEDFLTLASERFKLLQTSAASELDKKHRGIEEIVKPVKDSLDKFDSQIQAMEGDRREAYGTLAEQVKSLLITQDNLRTETANLVRALRVPTVRGRWGEMQLRRVVEIAGMADHCDFDFQPAINNDGALLRPDMLVRLPGHKSIVVDAKAPLMAYLEALEATDDEERAAKLKDHAQQLRTHMVKLSAKAYWDACPGTPELVVLVLPGEMFFSAALQHDPALIEDGAVRRVILATPTTLIALLKSVSYGWREQQIAENAQRISGCAQELHERLGTMVEHLARLGASLDRSIEDFNAAIGSFEGRVLPAARRFKELGTASKKEIGELTPIDKTARALLMSHEE